MPYNTLLGYVIADSACRTLVGTTLAHDIHNTFDYPDSIRYLLKYIYAMNDYDPILFRQYCSYGNYINRSYKSDPFNLMLAVDQENIVLQNADSGKWIHTIMDADGIYHIRISSISNTYDSISYIWYSPEPITCITAQPLDTIKGQKYISCGSGSYNTATTPCLQFAFYPYSPCSRLLTDNPSRLNSTRRYYDNNGDSLRNYHDFTWSVGGEYIVFLQYEMDMDTAYDYFRAVPEMGDALHGDPQGGIYPIVGGMVQDYTNYWGLGTSVSVSTFENKIKSLIANITK